MPTAITPIPGINLTYDDLNILLTFQKLMLDQVQWLRNHLIGVLENIPSQTAIETKLFLELPVAEYNELRKYTSDEVAHQFMNIVVRFTLGNWRLTNAYKNEDTYVIDMSISQWNQTADELVAFFAENFQYLEETQWRNLVYELLNLKIEEINALVNGDYNLEIKLYDQIENKAIEIGNNMALSIIEMHHHKKESLACI